MGQSKWLIAKKEKEKKDLNLEGTPHLINTKMNKYCINKSKHVFEVYTRSMSNMYMHVY
jgi:hypothetical protein